MKTILLVSTGLLLTVRIFAATPLHHYGFNGSDVVDSVGSAEGTLLGGAMVASGILMLDGVDGYVQFNERLIPTTGSFSVTFFARELSPTSDSMEMISQGCSYCPGFYIGYFSIPLMRVGDEWQDTGVSFPSDGLFHHYTVTANSTETRFYIDGDLVATHPPIHLSADGDPTRLGKQFQQYGENFHGDIEELWVFAGTLTDSEVKTLAASPLAPGVESLIAELDNSTISAKKKHPLLAELNAAQAAFTRGRCATGIRRLVAFQGKVQEQLGHSDGVLDLALIATAQAIIDAGCP